MKRHFKWGIAAVAVLLVLWVILAQLDEPEYVPFIANPYNEYVVQD